MAIIGLYVGKIIYTFRENHHTCTVYFRLPIIAEPLVSTPLVCSLQKDTNVCIPILVWIFTHLYDSL